jgi:hypothetical protein
LWLKSPKCSTGSSVPSTLWLKSPICSTGSSVPWLSATFLIYFCGVFKDDVSIWTIYCQVVGCPMNDELGRTWKEVIIAWLRYFPRICQDGLRKSSKDLSRIADVLAKIRSAPPEYRCRGLGVGSIRLYVCQLSANPHEMNYICIRK